jgi:hypothetical protein
LKGGIVLNASGDYQQFNKHFNRYETRKDHTYPSFNYQGYKYLGAVPYPGKIKCRLVHSNGMSVIIPDYILLRTGWIQPLHFTAPLVAKLDDTTIVCDLFVDIPNGQTVKIRFFNTGLITSYPDRSQLFDCEIYGPPDLEEYISGEYQTKGNKIYLKLYHHTNEAGFSGITGSKSLRSSRWNYRGSKECANFNFVYFTHIPAITFASDLVTVAMSSDGNIDYAIDSFQQPSRMPPDYRTRFEKFIYTAAVYRATTADRNRILNFYVPIESIDVKHIYLHQRGFSFSYEICFPYVHRIKTVPASALPFDANHFFENAPPIVNSDYCILGDARTKEGLAAPFEEEETMFVFKMEDCGSKPLPDFWIIHSNKDLFSSRTIDPLQVKDVATNPTTPP